MRWRFRKWVVAGAVLVAPAGGAIACASGSELDARPGGNPIAAGDAGNAGQAVTEAWSGGSIGVSGSGGRGGATSGGAASGGSTNGGAAGATTGGASTGGTPTGQNGCRSSADCPPSTMSPSWTVWSCVLPFETAPPAFVSGIPPGWCGTTYCPPLPTAPTGTGLPCMSAADCESTAAVCSNGLCSECAVSTDCPAERPACARIGPSSTTPGGPSGYNACVECSADTDCSAGRPRCLVERGLGGKCYECRTHDDCAEGVCAAGSCTPGCMSDSDCANPATPCSSRSRCEALACDATTTCPENTECQAGICRRAACTTDDDCDLGYCLGGACYETLGYCASQVRGA